MDKYDNMLLKARAEMLGQNTLRKAPPHDALFSHVWNHVIKAPGDVPLPAAPAPEMSQVDQAMRMRQQRMNDERTQAMQQRTQSSPAPADPFGQMNEGASLDGPTQGMGANFRQGRSETRDPNKTGMFGRAKQGIGNFMNRFKRQPSQQTESTPPSLQEEQAPQGETRAFRDMPRAEYPPSFRMATSDQRGEDNFPTRESVVRNARAGSNDLAEWDRMNAIREQREAEAQPTQQAEQGTDFRAATRDKLQGWNDRRDAFAARVGEDGTLSPMQEAQEMQTPVEAGLDAMREQPKADDGFYDAMTVQADYQDKPPFDTTRTRPETPPPMVEEQREFADVLGQTTGEVEEREEHTFDKPAWMKGMDEEEIQEMRQWHQDGQEEQREELPADFNTEIEPQQTEENPNWWDKYEGIEEQDVPEGARGEEPEMFAEMYEEDRTRATTPTGTKIPRKALPAPKVAPENRQLPESTGENEPGEMAGIPSKPRTGFNEVNNRSDEQKRKQQPDARSRSGRLEQRERGEKRMAARSVDPTEATERVLNPPKPKKASKKKAAKKGPAAKAVKATASKRKAKAKPLEGTEEMREEAPPKKGASKVEETTSKKAPKMEIGEGAERIEAKPKKGASKVKAKTSKAKPKKGSALASVNAVAEQRKEGKDPSKNIFANKAKPARKRTKNPKKQAVKGLAETAAKNRSAKRAEAKKNEPSEESEPEKEYGLSISGMASRSEIDEIMEAARSGNKSAQSAIYNNAGTLEDSHGISQEEIDEASGR
jgi:hypothetical protein